MKAYRSVEGVRAAKVTRAEWSHKQSGFVLTHGPDALDYTVVSTEWVGKHAPRPGADTLVGGYLVLFPGGPVSWVPADAFEARYTEDEQAPEPRPVDVTVNPLVGTPEVREAALRAALTMHNCQTSTSADVIATARAFAGFLGD